ncbi:MAG: inorganic phosphate transporter, partial [Desulfovibrionales bacterium]|nr:inorganic phosphate transporter [Desulfovibrionales bacterium]
CPLLSGGFAVVFYLISAKIITQCRIHMFTLDAYTRWSMLVAGIFGSYALGANNIANVMGIFISVSPFETIQLGPLSFSSAQQLFFIGSLAIALGVITYSKKVMMTVGTGIVDLSPVAACTVVWSHSIVLFLFSSQELETFLTGHGLPSIPLVPVSSSQAIVGAVMGIGLLKTGLRGIKWKMVGSIASGWITTPIIAAIICFISLFFLQNVFQQEVYKPTAGTNAAIHSTATAPNICISSKIHALTSPPEDG